MPNSSLILGPERKGELTRAILGQRLRHLNIQVVAGLGGSDLEAGKTHLFAWKRQSSLRHRFVQGTTGDLEHQFFGGCLGDIPPVSGS